MGPLRDEGWGFHVVCVDLCAFIPFASSFIHSGWMKECVNTWAIQRGRIQRVCELSLCVTDGSTPWQYVFEEDMAKQLHNGLCTMPVSPKHVEFSNCTSRKARGIEH